MIKKRQPTLSDVEMDAAFREDATDEEIASTLRDPFFWSYIVRDPGGEVVCCGRGKTRVECESWAVKNAVARAAEMFFGEWRGDWHFRIWPPTRGRAVA
jgi:hypothetical protein